MPALVKDVDVPGHVAALLRGDESVDAFIEWFWSAHSAIDQYGNEIEYDLSCSVENWLYQLDGGYIDEAELLEGLREDAVEFCIGWQPVAQPAREPRLAS